MTTSILKATALALTFALTATAVHAREDPEDPAISGIVLTQEVLDLIHATSDPASRESAPAQLMDLCPRLAVSG